MGGDVLRLAIFNFEIARLCRLLVACISISAAGSALGGTAKSLPDSRHVNSAAVGRRAESGQTAVRQIYADVKSVSGPLGSVFRRCVGAGRANEGLRADWQRQLREAKRDCGFEYIRMHGLLTDDMGVYREERGRPVYNWQYIDELYDFLIDLKVRPFVELGFMPGGLASGNKTIFWWRGNTTPPKDYAKWGDLIAALVKHWKERYGAEEVKKWYFEVWNEPNLDGFWAADQKAYFHLYTVSANAIKSVSPSFKVGGPATAGNAWVPEFINYCSTTHSPLDFITTHTYGVDVGFLDEFGGRGTVLSKNPDSVSGDVKRVRLEIKASSMPSLPLYYTEWSSSYTPADPVHDSYVSAAYILDKLKGSIDYADCMSYWTFTDIFEEAGPRSTPFHGGFGLINYQDIKKPAYRAYEYLNKLGPTKLQCGDSQSLVTKDASGIQALFWDFTNSLPVHENNQQYYITDIKPKVKASAKLRISNLEPGRYKVSVYRVGYRINDPYEDYFDLGRPSQLTRPQVETIKRRNDGRPVQVESVQINRGEPFMRTFSVRENDVFLVQLEKGG
jgi:xylan 1,4-beta-xylosidase